MQLDAQYLDFLHLFSEQPRQIHSWPREALAAFLTGKVDSYQDAYDMKYAAEVLAKRIDSEVSDMLYADFHNDMSALRSAESEIRYVNAEIRLITQELRAHKHELKEANKQLIEDVATKMNVNKWTATRLLRNSF